MNSNNYAIIKMKIIFSQAVLKVKILLTQPVYYKSGYHRNYKITVRSG